jgi:hypothetical protein
MLDKSTYRSVLQSMVRLHRKEREGWLSTFHASCLLADAILWAVVEIHSQVHRPSKSHNNQLRTALSDRSIPAKIQIECLRSLTIARIAWPDNGPQTPSHRLASSSQPVATGSASWLPSVNLSLHHRIADFLATKDPGSFVRQR